MATVNNLSEVAIANMALSRIGSVSGIQSLDTTQDTSTEAMACAQWYPQDRDALLTDFPWTWAQGAAVLSQVNTTYPASPEYQYSYRYPANCLHINRLVPTPTYGPQTVPPQTTGTFTSLQGLNQWWLRPEGDANPWPFRINSDATGRLVMTDLGGGTGVTALIVQAVNDPTQFSADFADLLAWRLARSLAYAIATSDARREMATKMYHAEYQKVRARMSNESQSDIQNRYPNSGLVRARWGW